MCFNSWEQLRILLAFLCGSCPPLKDTLSPLWPLCPGPPPTCMDKAFPCVCSWLKGFKQTYYTDCEKAWTDGEVKHTNEHTHPVKGRGLHRMQLTLSNRTPYPLPPPEQGWGAGMLSLHTRSVQTTIDRCSLASQSLKGGNQEREG